MEKAILECHIKLVINVVLLMFSWTPNVAGILIQGTVNIELQ